MAHRLLSPRVMVKAWFSSSVCAMALVIVACGGDEQPATPASAPEPTSVPTPDASVPCSTAGEVSGDCQHLVCNPDGTTRTIADDTDVPPSIECMTFTCSAGTKANTPKAAGTACTGGLCDGEGTCVLGVGTACNKAEDCPSGSCVDGVCCNEACTGECKSCSVEGVKGICSNVPYYQEDPSFVPAGGSEPYACDIAGAGGTCDGAGKCRKVSGVTCTLDDQCMSGKCSNLKCLGAKGEMCNAHDECVSGTCVKGGCN